MHRFYFFVWIITSLVQGCSSNEVTPHFDVETFRKKAEKILNEIPDWEISLQVSQSEEDRQRGMAPEEVRLSSKVLNYHFSGNDHALFYIREMQYSSQGQAQEVFEMLKQKSKGGDETPGLTYTNDFLFTKGTTIFWLNTACRYSWTNHTLLVKAFKSSFDGPVGKDTISCQCGFECD